MFRRVGYIILYTYPHGDVFVAVDSSDTAR